MDTMKKYVQNYFLTNAKVEMELGVQHSQISPERDAAESSL